MADDDLDKWWEDRLARRGSASKIVSPKTELAPDSSESLSASRLSSPKTPVRQPHGVSATSSRSKSFLRGSREFLSGEDTSPSAAIMSRLLGEEPSPKPPRMKRSTSAAQVSTILGDTDSPQSLLGNHVLVSLKRLFSSLDKNSTGTVDRYELIAAMRRDPLAKHSMDDASFEQVLRILDTSEKQQITWEQFELAMLSQAMLPLTQVSNVPQYMNSPQAGTTVQEPSLLNSLAKDYKTELGPTLDPPRKPLEQPAVTGHEWWQASSLTVTEKQCMEHIHTANMRVMRTRQQMALVILTRSAHQRYGVRSKVDSLVQWQHKMKAALKVQNRRTAQLRSLMLLGKAFRNVFLTAVGRRLGFWRSRVFDALKVLSVQKVDLEYVLWLKRRQGAVRILRYYGQYLGPTPLSELLGTWRSEAHNTNKTSLSLSLQAQRATNVAQQHHHEDTIVFMGRSYHAKILRTLRSKLAAHFLSGKISSWRKQAHEEYHRRCQLEVLGLVANHATALKHKSWRHSFSVFQMGLFHVLSSSLTYRIRVWRVRCLCAAQKLMMGEHSLMVFRAQLHVIHHVNRCKSCLVTWRGAFHRHMTLSANKLRATDAARLKTKHQLISLRMMSSFLAMMQRQRRRLLLAAWHEKAYSFFRQKELEHLQSSHVRQMQIIKMLGMQHEIGSDDDDSDEDSDIDLDSVQLTMPQEDSSVPKSSKLRRKEPSPAPRVRKKSLAA